MQRGHAEGAVGITPDCAETAEPDLQWYRRFATGKSSNEGFSALSSALLYALNNIQTNLIFLLTKETITVIINMSIN